MTVLLGLLAFVLLLNLAALTGWAPSTRDGQDWERTDAPLGRRGPVHLPATWAAAVTDSGAPESRTGGRSA